MAEEKTEIREDETAPDLRHRLNEIAKRLLPETIAKIASDEVKFKEQDSAQASYCKKIKKEDGLIDLAGDPIINYRKFRAYYGWPSSYFFEEVSADKRGHDADSRGKKRKIRIKITEARLENGRFIIKTIIPEGKKEISYQDFQNPVKTHLKK